MGLFSINYNKPGPGIDKDAPKKPAFFIFFEVFKRKFWNLLKISIMYAIFNIPAVIMSYFITSMFLQKITVDGGFGDLYIRMFFGAIFMMMTMVTFGPVQAGITYILRNYSREEHSFIWWDFKEHFKKNFKQGIIVTLIDFVILYLLAISINFYSSLNSIIGAAAIGFVIMTMLLFTMMHFFIYPMMVTVELSTKNLYKNALIFSILKFFPNLLMLVINIAVVFGAFYNIIVGVILYVFLLPGVVNLMNCFYADPIIRKYVATGDEITTDVSGDALAISDNDEPYIKPLIEDETETAILGSEEQK